MERGGGWGRYFNHLSGIILANNHIKKGECIQSFSTLRSFLSRGEYKTGKYLTHQGRFNIESETQFNHQTKNI